jgi:hypothetical protein
MIIGSRLAMFSLITESMSNFILPKDLRLVTNGGAEWSRDKESAIYSIYRRVFEQQVGLNQAYGLECMRGLAQRMKIKQAIQG